MDTIFIQPIFAPDKKRFDRNWDSLVSFFKYCDAYKSDVRYVVGGWCLDEYWTEFQKLINDSYPKNKLILMRFEKNYGKATIVNTLYKKIKDKGINFKYLLTCDSDILFPLENQNMIERLEQLATESVRFTKKPFGMASLNQLGENCHWKVCYQNQYVYMNKLDKPEKIVYPTSPSGIAGGCLFISKDCWENVGGYRQLGVYAGDDAWFLLDAANHGFSYQMVDSLGIVHPSENDAEYAKWKAMVCTRDSFGGRKKDNIDAIIKETEEFWNNKK